MSSLSTLLDTKIHQKISAQLKLPEYNEITSFIPGRDSYSVYELEGQSSIASGYEFTLNFVSDEAIEVEDIVDTQAELSLRDESNPLNSKKLYGKILKAQEFGSIARKKLYKITIVSPLHYLSLNKRYEIYQEMSVPDIIASIISKYMGLLDLQLEVKVDAQTIPKRHTCTQYAQSDLEFIQMLCEEEGFVLLVEPYAHSPYIVTLCELNEHAPRIIEPVEVNYNVSKAFKVSAQVQDYYDARKPALDFTTQAGEIMNSPVFSDNDSSSQLRNDLKKHSLRDRLEKLDESLYKDLNRYTKLDAQEAYGQGLRVYGESQDLNVYDGRYLNLKDIKGHKNTQVIILEVQYKASFPNALDEYIEEDTQEVKEAQYKVSFVAIDSNIIYRPKKQTPKPLIHSVQTAIVSNGNEKTAQYANEIDVNENGDIRVIFHFDHNRPTSCYIPLANSFSGDGYGTQFLPRVNSEVIVSFINGDIDRPIITGAIHNGENRHPYNLPKEKTKSFIKTQTTPQYEDKEGYNELLFEDKQGEELLSLRAQNDYTLNVLHDSHTHIENDKKTVIDNDAELTVANDSIQTVGNDKKVNIIGNAVTTIEKEQITTVKEDQELHILKDQNTIVKLNQKTIVEQDLIERIKGTVTSYVEKDQKEKYLTNLFMQVGKDLGIEVTSSYHVNAKTIKETAKTIELEAADGISLKCGGNVLTVDASGIHLKAATVDSNSGNGGVTSTAVTSPEIKKPLYNKLRVTGVTAATTKQSDLSEVLTYTASVEKYENGSWAATTELNETQKAQINWHFIKNNDEADKDILTDNPTDDTININGLEMSINVEEENIFQYGHAHAFVVDADDEQGYAVTELKRLLDVVNVRGKNLLSESDTEVKYRVELNIDNPTQEELKTLKVKIDSRDGENKHTLSEAELDESLVITHKLEKEHTTQELQVHVYPEDKQVNGAKAVTYGRPIEEGEVTNVRGDDNEGEYINSVDNDIYHLKADASLEEGTPVTAILHVKDENGNILKSIEEETEVKDGKIDYEFDIEKIIKDNNLDEDEALTFEGDVTWQA